jgi:hypothetical protein
MPEEGQQSLSDEQIKTDYRTDPYFFGNVLKEVVAFQQRLRDAGDSEHVTVPAKSLRDLTMGTLALIKLQTEFSIKPLVTEAAATPSSFGFDNDHGDRGAHCDYNPFIGINTGDLLPHTDPHFVPR